MGGHRDRRARRPAQAHPAGPGDPTTAVGKQYKPALVAEAAAQAITEALAADAGCRVRKSARGHQNGRLVVTVTGADPRQVRDAVAGFALASVRRRIP